MSDVFTYDETTRILRLKALAEGVLSKINLMTGLKPYIVIAGGTFTSWFHRQIPKDIDIFVLNSSATKSVLRNAFETNGNAENKSIEYLKKAKQVEELWNVSVDEIDRGPTKCQFIFTTYNTREELITDFDYKHCMASYHDGKMYVSRNIYDCIADKKLVVNNDKRVEQWRREKFLKRGFTESVLKAGASSISEILGTYTIPTGIGSSIFMDADELKSKTIQA